MIDRVYTIQIDLINDFQSAYLSDQRFTWRGTMHDGNINRGETGSGPMQQSPSHLLLDFLRALCVLLQVLPTWTLAALVSRLLLYPLEHLPRSSWSIVHQETANQTLVEALGVAQKRARERESLSPIFLSNILLSILGEKYLNM